jgi:hypothetical protein
MLPSLGSHSRRAPVAASSRSRRSSVAGEDPAEPFLARANAEDDLESVSTEIGRAKSLENTLDQIGFGEHVAYG